MNKNADAIKCFDDAIEINSKYSMAYNNKGVALNELNNYIEAIQSLDKSIELDENNSLAYKNKSISLNALKQYENAIEITKKAIESNPRLKELNGNETKTLKGHNFVLCLCVLQNNKLVSGSIDKTIKISISKIPS